MRIGYTDIGGSCYTRTKLWVVGTEASPVNPMKRREFVTFLGGAVAWPAIAGAQQAAKLRVGTASSQPRSASFWQAFEQLMAERGYQEGKNYTFDHVYVSRIEEFASSYQQLVSRGVDILVAGGPEISIKSALASSNTIPIVMVAIDYDPIARGYVTNLARPTGNVTGLFLQQIELTEKRLQLLKSAFPDMQAMTIFWDRSSVKSVGGSAEGCRKSWVAACRHRVKRFAVRL
jgi:ABC-type uncharacterized transport system substrate-binding protein